MNQRCTEGTCRHATGDSSISRHVYKQAEGIWHPLNLVGRGKFIPIPKQNLLPFETAGHHSVPFAVVNPIFISAFLRPAKRPPGALHPLRNQR